VEGFAEPAFAPVAETFGRQLAASLGGAAVCVYHRGRCVVDLWGGSRDTRGTPWTADTMAPSFSTTKGVASTVLHVLADRGLVDYDAPVADYWPAFAQGGKHRITVRHVLAHRAGLYHVRRLIDRADRLLDWEHMVGVLERAEPVHEPGARTGYHGLTFGFLVGELIRRVTGREFPAVLHETIAAPLGCDGLYVGAPPEVLHRAAELIWPQSGVLGVGSRLLRWRGPEIGDLIATSAGRVQWLLDFTGVGLDLPSILDGLVPRGLSALDFGAPATLQVPIPAANGLFTARSLARMYAALAAGGALDGVRLLSAATLARATEVQPRTASRAVIPFEMGWRLGYHGVLTSRGVPRNGFGHFGFGGSGAWAEPRRELAVGFIVNSGMGSPFGDFRTARISAAALEAVDALRGPAPAAVEQATPLSAAR
jgi:CubicO group peptidase (beta-lactamase class C family)